MVSSQSLRQMVVSSPLPAYNFITKIPQNVQEKAKALISFETSVTETIYIFIDKQKIFYKYFEKHFKRITEALKVEVKIPFSSII